MAYLSRQVTEIFPNLQIQNKKKRRLSEVRTGIGQGRGRYHVNWKSNRRDGGSGRGGVGRGGNKDCPYINWNGVDIQ